MTDTVMITVIGGIVTLATQILTMISARAARKSADEAKVQSLNNSKDISDNTQLTKTVQERVEKVATDINGKLTDFVRVSNEAERAKGRLEGLATGNAAGLIQGTKDGISQEQSDQKQRDAGQRNTDQTNRDTDQRNRDNDQRNRDNDQRGRDNDQRNLNRGNNQIPPKGSEDNITGTIQGDVTIKPKK